MTENQTTPALLDEQQPASVDNIGEREMAIVRDEEEVLGRVVACLAVVKPSRPPPVENYEEQLLSLRDQIASARLEDVPALVQQMERLTGIAARRSEIVVEPVDPRSPYFGHLRLREQGRPDRDVLIGRTTYIDAAAGVRIVDWRHAPVSQIYYRYEQGAEYEETFGERDVEGTLLVRRTVTIEDGKLLRIATPEGTFVKADRSAWRALAGHAAELSGGQGTAFRPEDMGAIARGIGTGASFQAREDRHLPEIAALLDPRQFELISKPDTGIVVIQGGAGSGKTTIGLHRIAFLAYNPGRRFTPDRMLVIVGSPGLRAYIGDVLPALGLDGIAVETYAEWARAARIRAFPWLEAPVEESTPSVVTRYKTHPAMLRLLEQRAREAQDDPGFRRDSRGVIWFWADLLTDLERVTAAFAEAADPEFGPEQVRRAWRWCSDRCPAVLDLDPGDRAERKAALAEEPEDVRQEIDEELGEDGRDARADDRAVLDPEDDSLLLRASQLLRGELRRAKGPVIYEHLFVDEAQDLAPIDLAVLLGVVSKKRSITLAGDTSQRLHMDSGFRDWRAALDDLGLSRVDVEPLRIAYRSTREVLAFARDVLGPLADPTPPIAPRSGAPVEHHHFPSAGAAVAFLADAIRPLFAREPRATLAILARHPEQADVYHEALSMAEIPYLRRIRAYEFAFRAGVEVTEIRQVKGLEYDYVVLVDVNASTFPTDDESRHLLHIAATRAAHQLWVISTGPPSPLLPAWLR